MVGAKVTLASENGHVVARRDLGTNVNVGSCSPPSANIAVRQSGKYHLTVRWSDGATATFPVEVAPEQDRVIRLRAARPK